MLVYPDGRRAWPLLGDMFYTEIPEIRQFQIVQHAIDDIEIKLVSTRRLSAEEEARVAGWLHQRCGHAFPVRITYHPEIPPGPSGKFLDFRSAMAVDAVSPYPGDCFPGMSSHHTGARPSLRSRRTDTTHYLYTDTP